MITIKISFLNTIEDLVILNKQTKASKRAKNVKIFSTCIVPITIALELIYDYLSFHRIITPFSISSFIFCIIWIIFFPKLVDLFNKKRLIAKLGPITFKQLTIELFEEGLEVKSESSEYKLPWNSVDAIITANDHILIYLNINSGVSIPFNAFSSSLERESFIRYLYGHTK
ncbi:YcxB family protein [Clostridium manihotivorum]|uniref:YcxB family protein n=1 Tax=Clostridium manihotivorum TaxID=2320868 RepID=UPI0013E2A933|nr:YcxB family protein [Clostridium manihotivorum]